MAWTPNSSTTEIASAIDALYRMLRSAHLLIAVGEPPGGWPDTPVRLAEDTPLPILTTAFEDGLEALVAFTSLEEMRRHAPDDCGYLRLPMDDVPEYVMARDFDALVLNPAGAWRC